MAPDVIQQSALRPCPWLSDAMGIGPGAVVALVGSGGKSSILFALADELVRKGHTVLTTTTATLWPPEKYKTNRVVLLRDEPWFERSLPGEIREKRHLTVAHDLQYNGKLKGLSPQVIEEVVPRLGADVVLVEGDAAQGMPLKAHGKGEPLIPATTSHYVAVVGIDGVDQPLDDRRVHQAALAVERLRIAPGVPITVSIMVDLLTHQDGYFKEARGGDPFLVINRIDTPPLLEKGMALARAVTQARSLRGCFLRGRLWRERADFSRQEMVRQYTG